MKTKEIIINTGYVKLYEMPKKIRELKQILRQAGFTEVPGKGSHTNWIHPLYVGKLTISGKDGTDAKRYQENVVQQAIEEVEGKTENDET